jgi:hypothetical protein
MNLFNTVSKKELQPLIAITVCGFIPSIYILFSAWRVYKNKEYTGMSPMESWYGWKKPLTRKGNSSSFYVKLYVMLGMFIFIISTTILLSIILP